MRFRSLHALALAACGVVVSETPALAQAQAASLCMAVRPSLDERTSWYDADGDFVRDTTPQNSTALAQRFAGAYTLLVVTTEGSLEKVLAEYELRLAAPNPEQTDQVRQIPAAAAGKLIVPLIATIEYRRGATGGHRAAGRPRPDITGTTNFEYWPGRGKLGFNVGLGIDTGTLFHITDVEADGSFAGRWTDGGLTVIQLDTPVGPVLEAERGYFCAMPRPR
jgi:hypothetical protein